MKGFRTLAAAFLATTLMVPVMSATAAIANEDRTVKQGTGATTASGQTVRKSDTAAAEEAERKAAESRLIDEAVKALEETGNAIRALQEGRKKDAIAAIERAIGKLEVVIARDPTLMLAPVAVDTRVIDILAPLDEIEKAKEAAKKAMKEHRLQEARAIVEPLASEIVIETTSIPLATYPDALKAVVPLIEKGKTEEALAKLDAALSTLIVTKAIAPLPLLRIESAIDEAQKLADKTRRTAEEEQRLQALVKLIEDQITLGKVLEYGGPEAFEPFEEELKVIKARLKEKGEHKGLFDKLGELVRGFGKK